MKTGLFFISLIFLCAFASLHAEQKSLRVLYDIKVYAWSFEEGQWSEAQLIKKITETYREDGSMISEELADGKGTLIEKTLYVYEGDVVKKTTQNLQNQITRTSVVTRKGNTATETVLAPEGAVLFFQVVTYDEAGAIGTMEYRDAANQLVYRRLYGYDKKGNLASIQNFNPDGTLAAKIQYQYESYNADGSWKSRSEYFSYADVNNRPHEIAYRTVN